MTRAIDPTQAIVLSGGGAYGAYEVGVMKALFTGECRTTGYDYLNPGVFAGTSVGAYNAAFMVSRPDEDICASIRLLESAWVNQIAASSKSCGNGVFRIRFDPMRYSNPSCLAADPGLPFNELAADGTFIARNFFSRTVNFLMSAGSLSDRALEVVDVSAFLSSAPLRAIVSKMIALEGIRRSDRALRLAASNWETGELRVFENRDMSDEDGHDIVIGSAAIPGVFHPHNIAGQPYVDGGLLMNTPLRSAIKAGGTTLHVIYMDPDVKNIPLRALQSSVGALDRVLLITSASKVGEDTETAAWINEGLKAIERAADGESLSNADMQAFINVAGQIYQKLKVGAPYKKLTIHRYHPHDDLGGGPLGLLNFDQDRIVALIERGFNDTLNHDCAASECVLP